MFTCGDRGAFVESPQILRLGQGIARSECFETFDANRRGLSGLVVTDLTVDEHPRSQQGTNGVKCLGIAYAPRSPSPVSVVDRKAVLVVYGDGFKATLEGANRVAGNPDKLVYMGNKTRRQRHSQSRMALDGTNQYNVRNTTVPSPGKSLGTDKCAIAEMRGPIRTLGQSAQPGDNGANDLSSLIEQNTLRLDGSHANRCAGALKSGELPLDVSTASNIAFDFTENSSEVAESLRQVIQSDRVTLEGDGQRIRHLADGFVSASARLAGSGQARRGGVYETPEEGEPSQRARQAPGNRGLTRRLGSALVAQGTFASLLHRRPHPPPPGPQRRIRQSRRAWPEDDQAASRRTHNGRGEAENVPPTLFSGPFIEFLGLAIGEGLVSMRRAATLVELSVDDLSELFAVHGVAQPANP